MLDVFQSKLVKRGISLKSLDAGDPTLLAKRPASNAPSRKASHRIRLRRFQLIRDEGPKGVKATIQGDELRVSSKSRDDLQSVISLLKAQILTLICSS